MIKENLKRLYHRNIFIKIVFFPFIFIKEKLNQRRVKTQKEFINRLSQILIEEPLIHVEEFRADFYLNPQSDLFSRLLYSGKYEPQTVRLIENYIIKNKDFIDIGANVGFYTVFCAKLLELGRVLAIEPTKNAHSSLLKNIAVNKVDSKVIVFNGVVSNYQGETTINTIHGKEEYSSLGKINHSSVRNEKTQIEIVKSDTIDNLVKINGLNPGMIKMDVEGMEHYVFEGAIETIKNYRPIILSELSDQLLLKNGASAKGVVDFLEKYDYDVYNPISTKLKPGEIYEEMICFPKELAIKI